MRNEKIRNNIGHDPIMTKNHIVRMKKTQLGKKVMEIGRSLKRKEEGQERGGWKCGNGQWVTLSRNPNNSILSYN